jgi:glycyl-tRNA synthetase beta chain
MSLPFLLEIGTEEIPDWMIVQALNHLQDSFQKLIDQSGVLSSGHSRSSSHSGPSLSADATPRRLVLRATGLIPQQPDTEELLLGPPKSAGPGAAAGFAKKMGATPDQLGTQSTAKGDYLSFTKKVKGRRTADILAESLPSLIIGNPWPKTMYWNGKGSSRFIRPIRWIVALLDNDVVPFEIEGVSSGNTTQGHRVLGAPNITVTVDTFEQALRSNYVELDSDARYHRIADFVEAAGAKLDLELARTLTYITEWPTPIIGSFDPEYLELPREILVTVMRHHQRYFAFENAQGELEPRFVAVMNTDADPEGLVRRGNERVLRARFNDARFFWQTDLKRKLEDRLPDLAHVTFQAKLGSYLEKTTRIVEIVTALAGDEAARRAAKLCKCDLTTDMVKEFTDLQGIVGGLYAREQGEQKHVWRAIYEHYKPLSMEDTIPTTPQGRTLALADKLDTLRECFRIGLVPTGSKDPFALRRAAHGVVKILAEGGLKFPITTLAAGAVGLRDFFVDRIEHYFRDARGFRYDEVRATITAGCDDLPDLEQRLEAVHEIRSTADFEPLAASFKRIKKILLQYAKEAVGSEDLALATLALPHLEPNLLEPGPETDLFKLFATVRDQVKQYRAEHRYLPALEQIASLRPKIDEFFDKVLVNVKDAAVRRNRLTLLNNLYLEFSTIADFSEIVTEKQD